MPGALTITNDRTGGTVLQSGAQKHKIIEVFLLSQQQHKDTLC